MSIKPIQNIPGFAAPTGTERLPNPSATPTPMQMQTSLVASKSAQVDAFTQSPLPARFPWINRLSRQLEPNATQRAAFPAAPALGDIFDQSA